VVVKWSVSIWKVESYRCKVLFLSLSGFWFFRFLFQIFSFFFFQILHKFLLFKKKNISYYYNHKSTENPWKFLNNDIIIVTKHNSDDNDYYCPEKRTNEIIECEFSFVHFHASSNKWHKSSGNIIKSTKNHKNTSTFLNLFFQIVSLCFSKTYRRTVFFNKLDSIFFSEPVTDLMSDIDTNSCDSDKSINMMFSKEASDNNDNILTWKDNSDNR